MNSKIIFAIPLFKPSNSFLEHLSILKAHSYQCIIWLNSEISEYQEAEVAKFDNVILMGDKSNKGLGKYLRAVGKYADKNKYEYLVNFDQDTLFRNSTIEFINNLKKMKFNKNWLQLSLLGKSEGYRSEKILINSGSIFNVKELKRFGFHDTNLEIDCVDYLFCLQASIRKFRLLSVSAPGIDHSIGQNFSEIKMTSKIMYKFKDVEYERYKSIVKSHIYMILLSIKNLKPYFFVKFVYFFIYQIFNYIKLRLVSRK